MAQAAVEYYSSFSSTDSYATTTTTTAAPEKPQKRRRISKKAAEQQAREQQELEARQKHKAESRACALEYVQDFLSESEEWSDRMDFISIIYDAVPTVDELFSYGALDRSEGTRACRKLFRAVVIWDELGLSLWEKLSASTEAAATTTTTTTTVISEEQQQQQQQEEEEFDSASTIIPCSSSRRTSEDSSYSKLSFWALSRSLTSSEKQRQTKRKWYSRPASPSSSTTSVCECCAGRNSTTSSVVDLGVQSSGASASFEESSSSCKSKSTLPRIIMKTWSKLSDKSLSNYGRKGIEIYSH